MRHSGHRTRFLILIAILFAVKIFFDVRRIRELKRQGEAWDELEKRTAETAAKWHQICEDSVKQCEEITGKPCGSCTAH